MPAPPLRGRRKGPQIPSMGWKDPGVEGNPPGLKSEPVDGQRLPSQDGMRRGSTGSQTAGHDPMRTMPGSGVKNQAEVCGFANIEQTPPRPAGWPRLAYFCTSVTAWRASVVTYLTRMTLAGTPSRSSSLRTAMARVKATWRAFLGAS